MNRHEALEELASLSEADRQYYTAAASALASDRELMAQLAASMPSGTQSESEQDAAFAGLDPAAMARFLELMQGVLAGPLPHAPHGHDDRLAPPSRLGAMATTKFVVRFTGPEADATAATLLSLGSTRARGAGHTHAIYRDKGDEILPADYRAQCVHKGWVEESARSGERADEAAFSVSPSGRLFPEDAAAVDSAEAQFQKGICYSLGEGVAQDRTEAVRYFRLAAEQGHADAQFNLGICYERGQGVAQDIAKAVRYYRSAAAQDGALPPELLITLASAFDRIACSQEAAAACCLGCGAHRKLKTCARCKVARFCGAECVARAWPAHKPNCTLWRSA